MNISFCIFGEALEWVSSDLLGRSQRILVDGVKSDSFDLRFNVPRGNCLGPLLFVVCVSKLYEIIQAHLPDAHCFADDTSKPYLSFKPNSPTDQAKAVCVMERCISDLSLGKTDRQVVVSGRKLILRRNLRWVAKRLASFFVSTHKSQKKRHFKADYPLFYWLIIG